LPDEDPEPDDPESDDDPDSDEGPLSDSDPDPGSDDDPAPEDDPPSFVPSPDDRDPRDPDDADPRSFFAQPEPRKWIVGGANCLRIVPSAPHDGQKLGPDSLMPWRMSARWPQALQTYS
jgi:hypothetical protein